MKKLDLLPYNGNYYKANLHCHTTDSDGKYTPEEVKKLYKEEGYQILAYTDHNFYQDRSYLSDADFLAISAMEVDINDYGDFGFSRLKTYHINMYDTEPGSNQEFKKSILLPERRYSDILSINKYIDDMKEAGFLACYNHPYWSLQSSEDYIGLKGLWSMEIYNHGCEVEGLYGYHPQAYDEMLRAGQRLWCVSTDDNHNSYPEGHPFSDSFGGYTMINAHELSHGCIMEALKTGRFYSCTGGDAPEFHEVVLEGDKLIIHCSPVKGIYVKTMGRNCFRAAAGAGETIDKAQFTLSGREGYIRIEIKDEKGLSANTNAWFIDDLMNVSTKM